MIYFRCLPCQEGLHEACGQGPCSCSCRKSPRDPQRGTVPTLASGLTGPAHPASCSGMRRSSPTGRSSPPTGEGRSVLRGGCDGGFSPTVARPVPVTPAVTAATVTHRQATNP